MSQYLKENRLKRTLQEYIAIGSKAYLESYNFSGFNIKE